MTDRLENIIENLYKVFSIYGATDMTGSALYEDLSAWNQKLLSKPLRELEASDLTRYAGKAITSWGNAKDYKHFLPRILELIAKLEPPYEIWITFDRIQLADFKSWKKEEQNLIHEYMLALWESILNDFSCKAEFEFKEYFTTLVYYYPNFNDLLDIWSKSNSKAAIKYLAAFIIDEQINLFEKRKISSLKDQQEKAERFINWLLSDAVINRIQRDYFEFETEDFADNISWAEQILSMERVKHSGEKNR